MLIWGSYPEKEDNFTYCPLPMFKMDNFILVQIVLYHLIYQARAGDITKIQKRTKTINEEEIKTNKR